MGIFKGGKPELFFVALLLTLAALARAADPPPVSLEYLSEYNIAGGTRFEETCLGGLSALYYDADNDRYFALSDSRRGARFYTLRIEIAENDGGDGEKRPRIAKVTFDRVVHLRTREGMLYPDDRVDPEGLALSGPRTAYLSSEGVAADGVPPFIDLIDVEDGAWLGTVPLPPGFRPRSEGETQVAGVRNNLGLEALTLAPYRGHLYTASESALAQDAAGITAGALHFARLLHFELELPPRLAGQYLYPLTMPAGDVVVHGLVELLALDGDGRLLALERTYSRDSGLSIDLFEIHLSRTDAGADRSSVSLEASDLPVLDKRHLLDFRDLPILLDNLEGLTFGPRLEDGSETLLVVGDNDNTECLPPTSLSDLRFTKFLLFRLRR